MTKSIQRKKTRLIHVGDIAIGGGSPIAVQSMTNTDTRDIPSTIYQIEQLFESGCEIVRLAVPDEEAAAAFKKIKTKVKPPLIADIHFDHRLALLALDAGADGLRINPGNIGSRKAVARVVKAAAGLKVPIRIGVNAGSMQKEILLKYGHPSPEAMVESALVHVKILEGLGFSQIKISLKSSNVMHTIRSYKILSDRVDYPLHLGVTEAGTLMVGTVKSAIGIGHLLAEGIGDTFRVSLTRDPVDEVKVAYEILRSLDLRHRGPEIISCPTCGRTEIDLFGLVERVEKGLSDIKASPKIAIMGCVVNGPGEAKEADIGIAGGKGQGILFKKGKVVRKIPENRLADALISEVRKMVESEMSSQ
ncbi:MAG TPA: 4-hydroxy-3-methylbut-2-en-1-yl diphosphate synthase [Desulfobacteraceae bacterium]|nr:4-hydroxy-3-methylbut-2-en-1-yl diphosphate synthase [Desulfobacteraceae bacterium]